MPLRKTEEYPGGPFTEVERRRLRRMMEADDRVRWFWATARYWVISMGAVATAWLAMKQWIIDAIKAVIK
jgi:hypothetical protein